MKEQIMYFIVNVIFKFEILNVFVIIMRIEVNKLFQEVKDLIPSYSNKFHISENGAGEFLKLAIIQSAKDIPGLSYQEDDSGTIEGEESNIHELQKEIENWDEEEFDLEDLEVIGYCKNIR